MTAFVKSIFCGCDGQYNIFDVPTQFMNKKKEDKTDELSNQKSVGFIKSKLQTVFKARIFKILVQQYIHTFVHEMGHVLALKILRPDIEDMRLEIYTNGEGTTFREDIPFSSREITIIKLSGPMLNGLFTSCKFVISMALKAYLSTPVIAILALITLFNIADELAYAYYSAKDQDNGDFGVIRQQGSRALVVSTALLVGQYAVGIILGVSLL